MRGRLGSQKGSVAMETSLIVVRPCFFFCNSRLCYRFSENGIKLFSSISDLCNQSENGSHVVFPSYLNRWQMDFFDVFCDDVTGVSTSCLQKYQLPSLQNKLVKIKDTTVNIFKYSNTNITYKSIVRP